MLFVEFLSDNWGTILVAAILLCLIIPLVIGMIKDKKSGKGACCGGCAGCPMSGKCRGVSPETPHDDQNVS